MRSASAAHCWRGLWALILTLSLALVSVTSIAEPLSPAHSLTQRMSSLDGMRAGIEQKIYANGVLLEESQGSIALAKPNLRWQVDTPFPQVILVKQNLADTVSETPADVLMQPERLLSAHYRVTLDRADAHQVYRLYSDVSSSLFQLLEIVFAEGVLASLTILDWQDQQTQIYFSDVEILSELPPSLFELSVPQDTDVIRG